MIRLLVNISANTVVLNDLNGVSIAVGESFEGTSFGEQALRESTEVQIALLQGLLKLNDGFADFTGQSAVDLIHGYAKQVTRDGKTIITTSDRPQDSYRHFTGSGDNIQTQVRGAGTPLTFIASPGQTVVKEAKFLEDFYLKDGTVIFENAQIGSTLSVEVVCPAGIPFPAPSHNGNFDLVGSTWTPNATNTGAYFILPVEQILNRFVNKVHLLGSTPVCANSPEPVLIPSVYIIRCTLVNAGSVELHAAVNLGVYRKFTT